jgi:iron complex outermembrane receptor protein
MKEIRKERIQPDAAGNWNRPLKPKIQNKLLVNKLVYKVPFTTGKIKHQLFTGIDLEKPIFTI